MHIIKFLLFVVMVSTIVTVFFNFILLLIEIYKNSNTYSNISSKKEKKALIKKEEKIKRKYKRKLKRYNNKYALDIKVLRYEYVNYINIVNNIVDNLFEKNTIKTNDMYLIKLNNDINKKNLNIEVISFETLKCLYDSIKEFPLIYTVDFYTKYQNQEILKELFAYSYLK